MIYSLSVAALSFKMRFIFSNTIMEQLKHRDSDSFCGCNMSCFYQVLHHITYMTGLC